MISLIRRHFLSVAILLLLGFFSFSYTGIFTLHPRPDPFWGRPLISSNKDSSILAPLVEKINNQQLFARDIAIKEFFDFYPKPFLWGLAVLEKMSGSLDSAYILGGILINVIFWLALYALIYGITGSRLAAVALALAATVYPRSAFGTAYWGMVPPSEVIPRNFFLALTPIILLIYIKKFNTWVTPIIFLGLGILANVHSLSAIHFALVLGLVLLYDSIKKRNIKLLVISSLAFIIGAFPEIYKTWQYSRGGGIVPAEILHFRLQNFYLPSWYEVKTIGLVMIWPVLLGILGFSIRLRSGKLTRTDRLLGWFLVSLIVISGLGIILMWQEKLLTFQILRITVYFYLWGFLYTAFFLIWLWNRFGRSLLGVVCKLIVLAILLLLAFPKYEMLAKYISGTLGVVVSWSQGAPVELPKEIKNSVTDSEKINTERTLTGTRLDNNQKVINGVWAVNFSNNWADYDSLCKWARQSTSLDSIFLAPSDGFALFRACSERGLIVTDKDGSQSGFSASYATSWYDRYNKARQLFESGTGDELLAMAKDYKSTYLILADKRMVNLPVAYSNDSFVVYRVGKL